MYYKSTYKMTHYLYTNLFCIFLVAAVFGANVTPVSDQNGNKTVKHHEELKPKNIKLVSEGGSILPSGTDLSLSKENITNLLSLDEEIGKNKEKPVKPRKGVDNIVLDSNADTDHENSDIQIKEQKLNDPKVKTNPEPPKNVSINSKQEQTTAKSKEVHKKPLILSYEALASADVGHIDVKPSSNTMASSSSQIPSPNEGSIIKKYITKANSHPGMIMPIVITILVVPMFAIVGYMALKRGKEAWKNRHYKRMDFLLDGMYND